MLNSEQVQALTEDFLSTAFYKQLLGPYLEGRTLELSEKTDRLILEDAPKNKFSVVSGRRQEIKDLTTQLEIWAKRNALPLQQKLKESRRGE